MSEKQVRIKDVAEKAGCSVGTVDRVLHNRGRVSGEVRQRVLDIIEELGYKPNLSASLLASKRLVKLGILLPAYDKGEYWDLPNRGIKDALSGFRDQGYQIDVVRHIYKDPQEFYAQGIRLLERDVDGIILSPATFLETVKLVRSFFQKKIPFILIDSDVYGVPALSFIGKDPLQSGLTVAKLTHQITKHIEGPKRIWIIDISHKLTLMYGLLTREIGFMNYFSDKQLREEYQIQTYEIENPTSQGKLDNLVKQFMDDGVPHAIYVTGSRAYKIAASLKRLCPVNRPLLLGHDLIHKNIEAVKDESIDFLIEEEATRQGYLAVETMIRHVVNKEQIDKKQLMNLLIYTKENLPADLIEKGS